MGTTITRGNISGLADYDLSVSAASVPADSTSEQNFGVAGVQVVTDVILGIENPFSTPGLGIIGGRVVVDNVIAITFSNNTVTPIVPAGARYRITVARLDRPKENFDI